MLRVRTGLPIFTLFYDNDYHYYYFSINTDSEAHHVVSSCLMAGEVCQVGRRTKSSDKSRQALFVCIIIRKIA